MTKEMISECIEMISEAEDMIKIDKDYPYAEGLLDVAITAVEASEFYKKDCETGKSDFPYSKMYSLMADALVTDEKCVSLMEKAHRWSSDDYELTTKLLATYFDYGLYDKALELALKTFRLADTKRRESELFYSIRRIGEGCCWELTEQELESAEDSIKKMTPDSFKNDFAQYGIPVTASEIRSLTDEDIIRIVGKCYPEQCEIRDFSVKERIRTHKDMCPYCGDNRYYVSRTNAWAVDAYGNETFLENGGNLIATCYRCRETLYVPWVEKKNQEKIEKSHEEYMKQLRQDGYREAGMADVMEKYGISAEMLDNIIVFSCRATIGYDDYDFGYQNVLQEMYDCPWIFIECMDAALSGIKEYASDEENEEFDRIYDNAVELSRLPCENLKHVYGVTPTAFVGTADEEAQIYINGMPIEWTENKSGNDDIESAIWRAVDKYKEIMGNTSTASNI